MMNNKKLTKIKGFAKDKMKEFYNDLKEYDNKHEDNLLEQFDWSNINLSLDNYSIHNYGMDLIEMPLTVGLTVDEAEKLEYQLRDIAQSERLGLYFNVDEDEEKLSVFSKALNNHVKDYVLIKLTTEQKAQSIINNRIDLFNEAKLIEYKKELKDLLNLNIGYVHIEIGNPLLDEENGGYYDVEDFEGMLINITDNKIILEGSGWTKSKTTIEITKEMYIKSINLWNSRKVDIEINMNNKEAV